MRLIFALCLLTADVLYRSGRLSREDFGRVLHKALRPSGIACGSDAC